MTFRGQMHRSVPYSVLCCFFGSYKGGERRDQNLKFMMREHDYGIKNFDQSNRQAFLTKTAFRIRQLFL